MTEEENIPYPEAHPYAAQIKELKAQIEVKYVAFKEGREKARDHYRAAERELKDMGKQLESSNDVLKAISKLLKELESIIGMPLL